MKAEIKTIKAEIKMVVQGLDELKEFFDLATKQAIELQETLNKIAQSEISVEFEPKIYKGENHETSSNNL